MIAISVTFCK